jgi:hypothetical protein
MTTEAFSILLINFEESFLTSGHCKDRAQGERDVKSIAAKLTRIERDLLFGHEASCAFWRLET